jgi:hypothetical protein
MSSYEEIHEELTSLVNSLIEDHDLDPDFRSLAIQIKEMTRSLTNEEANEDDWEEENGFIQYRNDIDEFFGE